MALDCVYRREVHFASEWSEDSYRFKSGDKAVIVNKRKCMELDNKFSNKCDHSFMAGKEVIIKDVLKEWITLEPTYTIEGLDSTKYFWEDSFFEETR